MNIKEAALMALNYIPDDAQGLELSLLHGTDGWEGSIKYSHTGPLDKINVTYTGLPGREDE